MRVPQSSGDELATEIAVQGDLIRKLKSDPSTSQVSSKLDSDWFSNCKEKKCEQTDEHDHLAMHVSEVRKIFTKMKKKINAW